MKKLQRKLFLGLGYSPSCPRPVSTTDPDRVRPAPDQRPAGNACMELKWSKPVVGWAKLNTDGSYVASNNTGGCGMVLRDAQGQIMRVFVSRDLLV